MSFEALSEDPLSEMLGRVCAHFGVLPSEYLASGRTLWDLHYDLAVLIAQTRARVQERNQSLSEFLSQSGDENKAEIVSARVLQWLGITS